MTILLSRRGVLRCLTGIIAAPAVVRADALMRVVAPKRIWTGFDLAGSVSKDVVFDNLGNEYESYTAWFRTQGPLIPQDWRILASIRREVDEVIMPYDWWLLPRPAAAHERA